MKTRLAAVAAALALIAFSSSSFAQQNVPKTIEYRKWDVAGSVGLLGVNRGDFGKSRYDNNPPFAFNLDAGRYLTTHLKADAGFMVTPERSYYDPSQYPQLYSYSSRYVRPLSMSGAATYQFFENVFAHPYVSGGVRLTAVYEEIETYLYDPALRGSNVQIMRRKTYVEARPFVAAGCKSYFNEWSFMKSELLVAVGSHGIAHSTLRVGFGVDF